ncbi:hypothetical protein [Thiohalorhabdus methylotrophus]|uniref:Flagellar assembly protein FliH n=1 Tax=Thiohalorhabdus methylotrophus TaxID=3242694 RepID=A0ABV4TZJ5_9GAMM
MAKTRFTPLQFRTQIHQQEEEPSGYEWLADLDEPREEPGQQPFHPGLEYQKSGAEKNRARAKAAPAPEQQPREAEAEEASHGVDPEELERLREEARQEGYNAGLLEGREKGEAEGREAMERVQSTFLDSFEQALKTLTEGQPESVTHWQEPLEGLIRTVCERVLRTALSEDLSGYLERLIVAALEEMDAGSEVRVTLGEVTPGLVEEMRERLASEPGMEKLRLHMEAGQPADFVRIETEYGVIQTTLESQLNRAAGEAARAAAGSE